MTSTASDNEQLVASLRARGAATMAHSGETLEEHLVGTAALLRRRAAQPEVIRAGLFHAVYGTEGFAPRFAPPWTRDEVARLIGQRAELLVFLYSKIARKALVSEPSEDASQAVVLPGHGRRQCYRVTRRTFDDLKSLALANADELRIRGDRQRRDGAAKREAPTFFRLGDAMDAGTRLAFIGVPSDSGSRKPGSRSGPSLLRQASMALCFRAPDASGLLNLETESFAMQPGYAVDLGDVAVAGHPLDVQMALVEQRIRQVPATSATLLVGGDHVFTLPAVLARARTGAVFVHVDQHTDCQVWGAFSPSGPVTLDKPTNANVVSHIMQLRPDIELLQVGVQGFISVVGESLVARSRVRSYMTKLGRRISSKEVECWTLPRLAAALPHGRDVYLSIDLDVLEGAAMAEVAYPAAVGVSYARLIYIVEEVIRCNRICGCDVMEFGASTTTRSTVGCRLGADLLARMLCLLVDGASSGGK